MALTICAAAVLFSTARGQLVLDPHGSHSATSSSQRSAPPPPVQSLALNFKALDFKTYDTMWNEAFPTVGTPLLTSTIYQYTNPLGSHGMPYTFRVRLNGWDTPDLAVTWGNGLGAGTYFLSSGGWLLNQIFEGPTASFVVEIDPLDAVSETNEGDNTISIEVPVTGSIVPEWDILRTEAAWSILGEGTDVVVGIIDQPLDYAHPLLSGVDSRGQPRLVAAMQPEAATTSHVPLNSEHATRIAGNALAKPLMPGNFHGLAADARFVAATFEYTNSSLSDILTFMLDNGADVVNMSWSWPGPNGLSEIGEDFSNLAFDYLSCLGVVCVGSANQGQAPFPTAPACSRNVISAGAVTDITSSLGPLIAWDEMDYGPTPDGRSKPDLLSLDAVNSPCMATRPQIADWNVHWFPCTGATSGATPIVTGAVAMMLGYAKPLGLPCDPKVVKAMLLSSCKKAFDSDGSPWTHSSQQPLDDQQGGGLLDLQAICDMYAGGFHAPGTGLPSSGFGEATAVGASALSFALASVPAGGTLDVSIAWNRHTTWSDVDSDGRIEAGELFVPANDGQDDLDLQLFLDGILFSESASLVDNIEHIHVSNAPTGQYEIRVLRHSLPNTGADEEFAIAWHSYL